MSEWIDRIVVYFFEGVVVVVLPIIAFMLVMLAFNFFHEDLKEFRMALGIMIAIFGIGWVRVKLFGRWLPL